MVINYYVYKHITTNGWLSKLLHNIYSKIKAIMKNTWVVRKIIRHGTCV